MTHELKVVDGGTEDGLTPRNMSEVMQLADLMSKSDMVPKQYQGKPGNVVVAILAGHPLGLSPFVACQSFAVINGMPSLFGDAMLAIVKGSGMLQKIVEECDGQRATCTVVRRGDDPVQRHYCLDDAKKAGLLGKQGPWQQHPARMLQMRARAFALRDVFPDVLKGLGIAEEQQDIAQTIESVPAPKPARLGTDAVKAALVETTVIVQESDAGEESQDTPEPTRSELFEAKWRKELTGLKDKSATDIAVRLKEAWADGDTEKVERIFLEEVTEMEDSPRRNKLTRFVDAIGEYLKGN